MSISFFQSKKYRIKYTLNSFKTVILCNYLLNDDNSNGCTQHTSDPIVDEFSLLCVSEIFINIFHLVSISYGIKNVNYIKYEKVFIIKEYNYLFFKVKIMKN